MLPTRSPRTAIASRLQREASAGAAESSQHRADSRLEKNALVMEFVEGPTLADRIAFGPVPVDEALAIARQIADALESAHERSIIHRDLKPANVKVRPDGTVKLLDFGLARAFDASSAVSRVCYHAGELADDHKSCDDGRRRDSRNGYTWPEQARGQGVDRRTDVWAFACVLFDADRSPDFDGSSVVDAIGAALHKEPEWHLLPKTTPPLCGRRSSDVCRRIRVSARAISATCGWRWTVDSVHRQRCTGPAASSPRWWPMALAILATAVIVGAAAWFARRPPATPVRTPVRFQIPAPVGTEFGNFFSLSPDGRTPCSRHSRSEEVSGSGCTRSKRTPRGC